MSLSRPPAWIKNDSQPKSILVEENTILEGKRWLEQYKHRLQHTLAHMNHHVHPLINANDDVETGERRPLSSCTTKAKPKICKGDFPLVNEMTTVPSINL